MLQNKMRINMQQLQIKLNYKCIDNFTSRGVLNPRPTFLWYLRFFCFLPLFLFKKTVGCFWKDFSFYKDRVQRETSIQSKRFMQLQGIHKIAHKTYLKLPRSKQAAGIYVQMGCNSIYCCCFYLSGSLETQTNCSGIAFNLILFVSSIFPVKENGRLTLKRTFSLILQEQTKIDDTFTNKILTFQLPGDTTILLNY